MSYLDGELVILMSENYPRSRPTLKPNFPELDNGVIKLLLDGVCDNHLGKNVLETIYLELENTILPDLRNDAKNNREISKMKKDLEKARAKEENKKGRCLS